MLKDPGRVERAILHALSMKRGRRGMLHLGAETRELARYVAHYKVCGDAIDARGHPYTIMNAERAAIAEARVRGEAMHHAPPTRSELESVRRALRNLRQQGLVIEPQRYPPRVYYRQPGKQPNYPD